MRSSARSTHASRPRRHATRPRPAPARTRPPLPDPAPPLPGPWAGGQTPPGKRSTWAGAAPGLVAPGPRTTSAATSGSCCIGMLLPRHRVARARRTQSMRPSAAQAHQWPAGGPVRASPSASQWPGRGWPRPSAAPRPPGGRAGGGAPAASAGPESLSGTRGTCSAGCRANVQANGGRVNQHTGESAHGRIGVWENRHTGV